MLWWPDELCERVANAGRLVIRYDHRDTGRSTSYPAGEPGYASEALADDAVAILDGYGIDRAHLVGMSMGGMLVQGIAAEHPDRVATVTAISTTMLDDSGPDLPHPTPEYMAHAAAGEKVDWTDADSIKDFVVSDCEALCGSGRDFDRDAVRAFIDRDFERTHNPLSLINHTLLGGEDGPGHRQSDVTAPLLVIHGTADPLFPIEHGRALAEATFGAELVELEGGGHELHRDDLNRIGDAIISYTSG